MPITRLLAVLLCAVATVAAEPVFPQPALPTVQLRIGDTTLTAEVADETAERIVGLMGRTELAENHGMLFVFSQPQPMSFWMRNTSLPLSIAYINAAGVIREIHDLQPFAETGARSALPDLLYALETPQGWFRKNKIFPGTRVQGLPGAAKE
jgi:uncharacterized membrane protein (UPF0127 family)